MQMMETSYKRRIKLIIHVLVLNLQGFLVLVKDKSINILIVQV